MSFWTQNNLILLPLNVFPMKFLWLKILKIPYNQVIFSAETPKMTSENAWTFSAFWLANPNNTSSLILISWKGLLKTEKESKFDCLNQWNETGKLRRKSDENGIVESLR